MSAIEISPISFISRGFSHKRLNISVVYDNGRMGFVFTLSRLNPRLMKLIWLIRESTIQPNKTDPLLLPLLLLLRSGA
jgi:hypothetical protein